MGGRPGEKVVGVLDWTLCSLGKLLKCSYLSSISECHLTNHSATLATLCLVPLGIFFPISGDGMVVLPLRHQGASSDPWGSSCWSLIHLAPL